MSSQRELKHNGPVDGLLDFGVYFPPDQQRQNGVKNTTFRWYQHLKQHYDRYITPVRYLIIIHSMKFLRYHI